MNSCKLLSGLVLLLTGVWAGAVPPGTADEIRSRLAPFGEVCRTGDECAAAVASTGSASGAMTGEQVYNQFCGTCHAAGVAGAPLFGDVAAWEPRLAKGMDTLWEHTLNGINAMPPKGTCMSCSDDELRGAMEYMLDAAQ